MPENIGALLAIPDVDGALVGGACLDPVLFAKILRIGGVP
jgi:triosephosphate isomerase